MAKKKINKPETKSSTNKTGNTKLIWKIVPALLIIAIVVYLIMSNFLKKNTEDSEYLFRKDGTLTFVDSLNNVKAKIDIQIAATDFDRELGLMYRKHMDENQGMLFIFHKEDIQNFWMRNTFIPLDMIYVNSKKEIVTIQHATQTLSDQTYSSTAPAEYVIEVNLNFTDKFNIKVGDKIDWVRTQPGL
ncbi:MAG: DUF192 domain-containing protein [Bacteroidetes bacterium]|nr:DUF192 domain-containing protein [Bacteroidota bacterium]